MHTAPATNSTLSSSSSDVALKTRATTPGPVSPLGNPVESSDETPERHGVADEQSTRKAGLLDRMVDATPASRDRSVDFLRALCIGMVVLWHWTLSMNHFNDSGSLSMPNPVDSIPGAWMASWVLQVMPLFFVIGGFANRAAWTGAKEKASAGWTRARRRSFVAGRLRRMGRPVLATVVCWAIFDAVLLATVPAYEGVLNWGFSVFVPLWFLAIYGFVTALSPRTVDFYDRHPIGSIVGLGALVGLVDIARFALELPFTTGINTLLVFVFAHQIGHAWHAGLFTGPTARLRAAAITATAFAALVALVTFGPYSNSMVAVAGEGISNMNPTTAPIAALAAFQLGLVGLAQPAIRKLCERRRVWKATIAVNAVAMSIFTWHMTALAGFMALATFIGFNLGADPTLGWWLARPLWVVGPGIGLAGLLALFARIELKS